MLPLAKVRLDGALKKLTECVETGWISSQGPFVGEFEEEFARWVGAAHAVSCSSGTAALHLALKALGIGPGDEVLVPSFTFIATANAVTYCGARPVFCDVDADTWCIDVDDAARKATERTKAIIPVHINGYPARIECLKEVAKRWPQPIHIVEDDCQALGSTWFGRKLGTVGDIGCFSFFANKHLTTGEGGMCVTDAAGLARTMRTLRDHGRTGTRFYVHDVVGFNYRMTNLQAAVGLAQLPGLEEEVERRKRLNAKWRQELGRTQPETSLQSPWLYHRRLENGKQVFEALSRMEAAGVESKPFYIPCHKQRPYDDGKTYLPVAEGLHGIMLPLHDGVTDEHISLVKETLASAIAV